MFRSLEQRASKLLETLDEKTSARISEISDARVHNSTAQGIDVSSLLGGELMSASSGALSAMAADDDAAATPGALSTPARARELTLTPTPATVLPAHGFDGADEQPAAPSAAQRKAHLAQLGGDLEVVLQHGHLLHSRLQKEGMARQASGLRIRELEQRLEEAAAAAAARELALREEVDALRARETSARAQAGREQTDKAAHHDELSRLEARIVEQAALAAAAGAESERLRQALGAQAAASAALHEECEGSRRELQAMHAAKAEHDRTAAHREGALESRAAELADALALASRNADVRAGEAAAAMAQLDAARANLARERGAHEASDRARAQLQREVEALGVELAGGSRGAGSEEQTALIARLQRELAQAEERARALAAEAEASRAENARSRDAETFLAHAVNAPPSMDGAGATHDESLRAQLASMSSKLAEQHEAIAQLRSDRSALKLELDAETRRRRAAEQTPRKASAVDQDMENGGGDAITPASRLQLKRRWAHRPGVARVMNVVDEAAGLIDRSSLQTTRFLTHNPYVRLAVACYIFILHLWVLVVLTHLVPGTRHRGHHAHAHGNADIPLPGQG